MTRVAVRPELLKWARERSGKRSIDLRARFPKLEEWEAGEVKPTVKQLGDLAKATYTPFGYLLLSEPPVEESAGTVLPNSG